VAHQRTCFDPDVLVDYISLYRFLCRGNKLSRGATPPPTTTMKDFVRRTRSNTSAPALVSSASSVASSPRMSILPSVRLPSLRRQDSTGPPAHDKQPLLTLTLSSPSFLDSSVKDIYSAEPLYQITTVGTSTTVSRKDPVQPSVIAASIKWPRQIPLKTKGKEYSDGVLVQMKGARWSGGETVLKPAASQKCVLFIFSEERHLIDEYLSCLQCFSEI